MNLCKVIVLLCSFATLAAGQLVSPDGNYAVEYFDSLQGESDVNFKNPKSGEVIHRTFSSGYEGNRFLEVKWSPDSRYLAVISRGTKTTADVEIFRFDGDSVTKVTMPDYRLNLLGRHHLVDGGRYQWVKDLRWVDRKLTFLAICNLTDSEPDQRAHYLVTLDLTTDRARLSKVEPKDSEKPE